MRISSKVIILWGIMIPAFAQEDSRLNYLEQQLNILRETLLDHENRLSEQQKHIERLQGEKELLTHKLDEIKKQQQDIYLDLDERLRGLQAADQTSAKESPSSSPQQESLPEKSSSSQSAVPEPISPKTVVPSTSPVIPPKVDAILTGDDKQDYQEIFKEVLKGNYQEVIFKFGAFLERYPQSEYASQAQYWIGDAQYASKQYGAALTTFKTLLGTFPNSPRSAQALLKMGYIYHEQKKFTEAKEILKQVKSLYPHTSSARLAEERLRQIYQVGK